MCIRDSQNGHEPTPEELAKAMDMSVERVREIQRMAQELSLIHILRKAEHEGRPKSFAQNDLHIDLEKLQKGDYLLQCFAAFVKLGDKTPGADPLVTALEEIDQFKRIMAAYPEKIAPVRCV